jgi:hypothetical protein
MAKREADVLSEAQTPPMQFRPKQSLGSCVRATIRLHRPAGVSTAGGRRDEARDLIKLAPARSPEDDRSRVTIRRPSGLRRRPLRPMRRQPHARGAAERHRRRCDSRCNASGETHTSLGTTEGARIRARSTVAAPLDEWPDCCCGDPRLRLASVCLAPVRPSPDGPKGGDRACIGRFARPARSHRTTRPPQAYGRERRDWRCEARPLGVPREGGPRAQQRRQATAPRRSSRERESEKRTECPGDP